MRRALAVLASVALTAALVAVPEAAHADNPPPKRVVSGWIPYWMASPKNPQGVNSAVQNAGLFVDVSPFWFSATSKSGGGVQVGFNPNYTGGAANAAWALGQLKAAGLTVLPSIADGSGKGRMAATLADPGLRAAHIADIVNLVVSNGYDGIDLDYETFAFSDGRASWAATQPNWTAFINELSAALHAQGKVLSVTIPPPCTTTSVCGPQSGYWVYNMAGIAPAADRIRVMAYDYHVQGIGPIAPMPWVRNIVSYSVTVMDPAKLQIGVPTYGRTWTVKDSAGRYQLSGNCPSSGTSAYRSLTSSQSVNDADIAALLTAVGKTPSDIQWSEPEQENVLTYQKTVTWTDSAGAQQTCKADRILWFVGPQGVLARTALVGEFGLNAAAYWTVGGEDPAQWPMLGGYGQSLAPASTDITAAGVPNALYGTVMTITATVASRGAPLAGIPATAQFRPSGSKKWVNVQAVATAPDGTVSFQVPVTGSGDWQVYVAGDTGRLEGASSPFTTQVQSLVSVASSPQKVKAGSTIAVKAIARPYIRYQKMALQIQVGDKWKNVATGKANRHGRETLRAKAPRVKGRYAYRVVAVGAGPTLAGASEPILVRVTK